MGISRREGNKQSASPGIRDTRRASLQHRGWGFMPLPAVV